MHPNPYAAHLLRAAADHEADGHADIARAMRSYAWAVHGPRTLEAALRMAVTEWDEEAIQQHVRAANDAARKAG